MSATRALIRLATALSFLALVNTETVEFFYNQRQDTCNWGSISIPATNQTENGGLCAYVSSISRVYACPAPDPACWTWGQTCAANNGTSPGPRQIQCDRGGTIWCCQSEETCTVTKGQINICVSQFTSPNSGVSKADAAAKEFSVVPSASIPTTAVTKTPSVIQTATFVAANAGTSTARTTSTSSSASGQSTQSSTASSTGDVAASSQTPDSSISSSSGSGLSGGAIAGIVIGVLVAIAIVGGALTFFFVRRRRARQNLYVPATEYYEVPGGMSENRSELPSVYDPSYKTGGGGGIGTPGIVRHELQ